MPGLLFISAGCDQLGANTGWCG